jgi:hypothetical protein
MTTSDVAHKVAKTLTDNSPAILTALGVSGVASTAYLAAKGAYAAAQDLLADDIAGFDHDFKAKTKLVWKRYIPATISGVLTATCIIGGNRASARRTAAAISMLTISERAFDEYKTKVIEQVGKTKEKKVRDEVAQDRVTASPPPTIVVGAGPVLCCELYTGRYFKSDMESLRRAENDINARLLRQDEVTLNTFYRLIHLPSTQFSGDAGWTIHDDQMHLVFSSVLTPDNEPCLAFEYSYVKSLH